MTALYADTHPKMEALQKPYQVTNFWQSGAVC